MKEVINYIGPRVEIIDSPIPEPNDDQVLVKVIISGMNPKDWKAPELAQMYSTPRVPYTNSRDGLNQGGDMSGIVKKVGANVVEFKPGDRVAAFHEMSTPQGSYAEYAIAWSHTTFHPPNHISFEEAATIPLAALTTAVVLYHELALPCPWTPATTSIPLVIYGGSTAVGSFAIKLAQSGNIHPIITIAGKGSHYLETLIDRSKGDTIIFYREGIEAVTLKIQEALKLTGYHEVQHAIDTANVQTSADTLKAVAAPGGHIIFTYPNEFDVSPVVKSQPTVGMVHDQLRIQSVGDATELGYIFSRYFTRAVQQGTFSGHSYEVREEGLEGVEQALKDLKEGKAGATKYVVRIADTLGLN
ncbi:chaperonin 10-like protein [Rhexocercosporidium sp. MPI-PUGE-AT-0058]|nr:chaperonin 10-like protein [Rhexocercosporidium sp. MPI-PUGE-AT-0058]